MSDARLKVTPLLEKRREVSRHSRLFLVLIVLVLSALNDRCWPGNNARHGSSSLLYESTKEQKERWRSIKFGSLPIGDLEIRNGSRAIDFKPARGIILVPNNAYVILKCAYEISGKPLLTLEKLCPSDLQELDFSQTNISDEGLSAVGKLSGLQLLTLSHTGIGDAGLKHLDKLSQLKELFLCDTVITDRGVGSLKGMRKLKCLHLSHTNITGQALAELSSLPSLRSLYADHTSIGDDDLKRLTSLPLLEELRLDKDKITDKGVQNLGTLTRLSVLCLSGTGITSQCLPSLKPLKRLRQLDLSETRVDDKALTALAQLPLDSLVLVHTKISKTGLQRLRMRLIHCKIADETPSSAAVSRF
jgi:hypothetical protein